MEIAAPSALDRGRPATTLPRVSTLELLKAEKNWTGITAKAAKFAFQKCNARTWEFAMELAQEAIFKTFEHPESWDPEREPLLKHVCKRVFSLAANHRARKRNTFEIAMSQHPDANEVPNDDDELGEALDRRRLAEHFRERLTQAFEGDEIAADVAGMWMDGVDTPAAQAEASDYTIEQIRDARRRIFYHSDKISETLAGELDDEEAAE